MDMSSRRWPYRLAVVAASIAGFVRYASALNVEYCSNMNTASTNRNASIYQSNGLCSNFCVGQYAFAVLQSEYCWCSNYAPSSSTASDNCDEPCPGFPNDSCGAAGLFGYIALNKAPSGTKSVQQSAATTTLNSVASDEAATTKSPASSTWTPTPVVSLETVTGQVRTITVTPTSPPNSQSVNGISRKGSGGLSTAEAVGLTVGLVALVAVTCGAIYFCIRKRRQEEVDPDFKTDSRRDSNSGLGGPVPSRTMSENSRYVLGTDGRQVVETWEPANPNGPGSRRSRLMPVDPRLDPFAPVYQRGDNKSRESVNTLRDDHDYSRRVHQQGPILRATNPDQ